MKYFSIFRKAKMENFLVFKSISMQSWNELQVVWIGDAGDGWIHVLTRNSSRIFSKVPMDPVSIHSNGLHYQNMHMKYAVISWWLDCILFFCFFFQIKIDLRCIRPKLYLKRWCFAFYVAKTYRSVEILLNVVNVCWAFLFNGCVCQYIAAIKNVIINSTEFKSIVQNKNSKYN